MFRLPRRQIIASTVCSMNELHNKIYTHLIEHDADELNNYMLEYSIFITRHGVTAADVGDRGTIRDAFITDVARVYVDSVTEVADAVNALELGIVRKKHSEMEACDECNGYRLSHSGHEVCDNCGHLIARGDESISAVPFGVVIEAKKYPYRRQHHFREWLCQIQGRESTRISEADMERMKQQIRKERVNVTLMDQKRLRAILKTLRLQKLYEHVPYLLHCIDGSSPPQLSHELEQQFMHMFSKIQEPFERAVRAVSPERKNFLSYAFVLTKFCQLAGRHDLLPYFNQLKSREKLLLQDRIWKQICTDLEWVFTPSV